MHNKCVSSPEKQLGYHFNNSRAPFKVGHDDEYENITMVIHDITEHSLHCYNNFAYQLACQSTLPSLLFVPILLVSVRSLHVMRLQNLRMVPPSPFFGIILLICGQRLPPVFSVGSHSLCYFYTQIEHGGQTETDDGI